MKIHTAALVLIGALVVLTQACEQDIAGQNEAAKADSKGSSKASGTIAVFDLRTGQCFSDPGISFLTVAEAGEVEVFPCDNPRAEFEISRMHFIEQEGSWPGLAFMARQFERECSVLDITFFYPTSESWELGDRTLSCVRALD